MGNWARDKWLMSWAFVWGQIFKLTRYCFPLWQSLCWNSAAKCITPKRLACKPTGLRRYIGWGATRKVIFICPGRLTGSGVDCADVFLHQPQKYLDKCQRSLQSSERNSWGMVIRVISHNGRWFPRKNRPIEHKRSTSIQSSSRTEFKNALSKAGYELSTSHAQ